MEVRQPSEEVRHRPSYRRGHANVGKGEKEESDEETGSKIKPGRMFDGKLVLMKVWRKSRGEVRMESAGELRGLSTGVTPALVDWLWPK